MQYAYPYHKRENNNPKGGERCYEVVWPDLGARGSGGAPLAPPAGSGAEPQPPTILRILNAKDELSLHHFTLVSLVTKLAD